MLNPIMSDGWRQPLPHLNAPLAMADASHGHLPEPSGLHWLDHCTLAHGWYHLACAVAFYCGSIQVFMHFLRYLGRHVLGAGGQRRFQASGEGKLKIPDRYGSQSDELAQREDNCYIAR